MASMRRLRRRLGTSQSAMFKNQRTQGARKARTFFKGGYNEKPLTSIEVGPSVQINLENTKPAIPDAGPARTNSPIMDNPLDADLTSRPAGEDAELRGAQARGAQHQEEPHPEWG